MTPEFRNRQELEERILLLEKENQQLADKAEDSLMLGLISEAIGQLDDISEMLDIALERISMLKAIPFVACCSLDGNQASVIHSYLSFSHDDVNDYHFQVNDNEDKTLFIHDDSTAFQFLSNS
ncbi:MAG: hypothetical protein ACE5E3_04635, partial [Mariprofundus sp.]